MSQKSIPAENEVQFFLHDEDTESGFIIRNEGNGVFKAEEWRHGDIVDNQYGSYDEVERWTSAQATQHNDWRATAGLQPVPWDPNTGFTETDHDALVGSGIIDYCDQVCGGGNCGSERLCQYGIDTETHMPPRKLNRTLRANGDVVDDVIRGQNVVARVSSGNYLPVGVIDRIPKGSPLLHGMPNPEIKHWAVRHLSSDLFGQVVPWPARDLFQNVSLAQAYDAGNTPEPDSLRQQPHALSLEQHARILRAYVCRLQRSDLRGILDAIDNCWHEQLCGNGGSQFSADKALDQAVLRAITGMIPHDRSLVETIVAGEVNATPPLPC